VARTARQMKIDYAVHAADPAQASGQNFQQWARSYRYALFEKEMQRQQADGIAVAHHRDDQIETIVQKIFRGGGLASWSGMPVWDGRIFRPLLDLSRDAIERYAGQQNIPFRTDRSNLDSEFARNLLRNEWLPKLEAFFPGWQENILRSSGQAALYKNAIQWIAGSIAEEGGIDRDRFHSLDTGLQKALILHLLKQKDPSVEVSHQSLEQIGSLKELQTGQSIQLTDRFMLLRDRGQYRFVESSDSIQTAWQLERSELTDAPYRAEGLELSVIPCSHSDVTKEGTLFIDADKLEWPISLRPWQDGDRFQPLGMEGRQLISDHLTNRKVSSAHRRRALVIESFEERICAVIFPPIEKRASAGTVSEQVKCDPDTLACLTINVIKST